MSDKTNRQPEKTEREPLITAASVEEPEVPNATAASEAEIGDLEKQITAMEAAAKKLEDEINDMQAKSAGDATSIAEIANAKHQMHEMRTKAGDAQSALANAPVDSKGKKKISSKRVTELRVGMDGLMIAATSESCAISEATAETQAHKAAAEDKAKSAAAKTAKAITKTVKKCTTAVASAVGVKPPQHEQHRQHWINRALDDAQEAAADVEANVSGYAKRAWNGITNTTNYVMGGLGAMATTVGNVGGAAVAGVKKFAGDVGHSVSTHLKSMSDTAMSVIDYVNPLKAAPAAAKPAVKPHKAAPTPSLLAQAEAAVGSAYKSLPTISVPSISSLVPSVSLPSISGVTSYLWSSN